MQRSDRPRNVNPAELMPARGFAHATIAGETVWIGGQNGADASGNITDQGDVVAQFARTVQNLAVALRASGCDPEDTVRLTYYVTDLEDYRRNLAAIGTKYREVFGHHYPASTLIQVSGLFDPDALIEIDAVAVRRS